jgi:hypothetical protein
MMKKYEYKMVSFWRFAKKNLEIINELGEQGWELVCVWGILHYFKREKKN